MGAVSNAFRPVFCVANLCLIDTTTNRESWALARGQNGHLAVFDPVDRHRNANQLENYTNFRQVRTATVQA